MGRWDLPWAAASCSFSLPTYSKRLSHGRGMHMLTQGKAGLGRVIQNVWNQLLFCFTKGQTVTSQSRAVRLSLGQFKNPWFLKTDSFDVHDDMGLKCSFEVSWGKINPFAHGLPLVSGLISESKLQGTDVVLNSSVFIANVLKFRD